MSQKIDKQTLAKLARLSRLKVESAKADKLCADLSNIFSYMEELNAVDVKNVEAMSHVHGSFNDFREDKLETSLEIQDALLNAPDKSGRFIRTPLIID